MTLTVYVTLIVVVVVAQIQFPYLKGLYKYKSTSVYVTQGI
ncbi:hypothetical protein D1AOALGA4SA_6958 [Olavius algarvensis Delta 1 endosymbiont]|nr:hypothetical protein D1AOALGA4SA_6958 [Olavius algarvensis Delta 1 endosymbiont]